MSNSNKQNTNINYLQLIKKLKNKTIFISSKTTITIKIIINSPIKQPGLKALTSGNEGGQVGGHEHLKQTTGTAMQYIVTLQEKRATIYTAKIFTNHFHNFVFQCSDHPKRLENRLSLPWSYTHAHTEWERHRSPWSPWTTCRHSVGRWSPCDAVGATTPGTAPCRTAGCPL